MKRLICSLLLLGCLCVSGCGEEVPVVADTDTLVGSNNRGPHVVMTVPENGALGVMNGTDIVVKFDSNIDPLTVSGSTIYVRSPVAGDFFDSWPYFNSDPDATDNTNTITPTMVDAKTVRLAVSPTGARFLPSDSCFGLVVTTGIRNMANVAMEAPYTSCFCTDGGDGSCPQ